MTDKRNILLGVTGSIAAYKSVDIARRLIEEGAHVTVVMTEAACRFIPPYTLETITGNPVHTDLFKLPLAHINLAKDNDLFIIAPVTANTINRLACGIADDLLSNIWLAYEGPAIMAPAMNHRMYRNKTVQKHIRELKGAGVQFIGPDSGSLACGEEGAGRMAEVPGIVEAAVSALAPKDLRKHHILVTAGPTVEPLDPVRFISNRSSGKMGYAVAGAAARRGAGVTLISGPSCLKPPEGVAFIPVETASEMESAVLKNLDRATAVVMAAAVSDFSPAVTSKAKHKKDNLNVIKLKKNNDILQMIGKKTTKKVLIGFAAETGRDVRSAEKKMIEKNLDMIVLNDVTQKGAGFNTDTNIVTIIDKKGNVEGHPLMKKIDVANIILDKMREIKKR